MAQLCASVQPLSGLFDKGLVGLDLTREWDSSTNCLVDDISLGCVISLESPPKHTHPAVVTGILYLFLLLLLWSQDLFHLWQHNAEVTACWDVWMLYFFLSAREFFALDSLLIFSTVMAVSHWGPGHHVADQHVCIMHHHEAPAGAWIGGKGMFNAKNYANTAYIFCLLLPSASWPFTCSVL